MAALVPAIATVATLMVQAKNMASEVKYVKATLDGQKYLVLKKKDAPAAANLLALVRRDLESLVAQYNEENPKSDAAARLVKQFDGSLISEGNPDTAYTSYTVRKARIVLCIRQKGGIFVPKNVIMYVAIHELAHVMTASNGHTPEFWENNELLLTCAEKMGIYWRQDFSQSPQPYCGLVINS